MDIQEIHKKALELAEYLRCLNVQDITKTQQKQESEPTAPWWD